MSIYFEWTPNMSVGESKIDTQHQKLLAQINKIIDAMAFGATSKEVKEALNFFDTYVREHFAYEEEYMKNNNYPNIDEHKKHHKEFSKTDFDFKKKLVTGADPRELIMEIETFLGQWWLKHIGKEDQAYHTYIEKIKKGNN